MNTDFTVNYSDRLNVVRWPFVFERDGDHFIDRMKEPSSFNEVKEKIYDVCQKSVENILADKQYNGDSVKQWSEDIVRSTLRELNGSGFQPFKYLANCMILSKRSSGVHTVTMSLWDPTLDGTTSYQWANDTMQCILTVWGMKF